ncbi:MAG: hypothetical protein WBA10_17385 [Elainellaceae cyanobacterium]
MVTITSSRPKASSVDLLLQVWSDRYAVNLSSFGDDGITTGLQEKLAMLSTWDNRWKTSAKLSRQAISAKCRMASVQLRKLCKTRSAMMDLQDMQRLSEVATDIYLEAAEIYQQPADPAHAMVPQYGQRSRIVASIAGIGEALPVEPFAARLEPLFAAIHKSYGSEHSFHSLSALTTLLNRCNRLILDDLSEAEQILMSPYLRFAEEQGVIPWRRLCHSANHHTGDRLRLTTVKYGMSKSQAIAHRMQSKIDHQRHSSDGVSERFDDPSRRAFIRNIEMMQAYFWLSFMHENLMEIEQELVPLCTTMGLMDDGHSGSVVTKSQALANEILSILNYDQLALVQPHAARFVQTFASRKSAI